MHSISKALCKGQKYCICILQMEELTYRKVNWWARTSSVWTARPSSYYGRLSTTRIPADIRDIIYCLCFCLTKRNYSPELLTRNLSLWRHKVFSSHYGKPLFTLLGLQLYFAWHENKVNYILEGFANEILKPVSVIKLTAMLFSSIEGGGRSAVH